MKMIRLTELLAVLFITAMFCLQEGAVLSQTEPAAILQNGIGLRMFALRDAGQPILRVILPGHSVTDRTIEVLLPEHVTAVKHGSAEAKHLFLPRAGTPLDRTAWRSSGHTLEYERKLPGSIDMSVRATLEEDGIRFQYEFTNRSSTSYDMIYAVTDPRLTGVLHDVRMERTYVHHPAGFELLASNVPARLTLPLDRWLPCRILASFTWPVPGQRVEKRDDGITYYNKASAVDVPLIVTQSSDKEWVVASFSRSPGNVWSNPELTCQHVDPQTSLSPQQRILLEVKLLVIRGTLEDALRKAISQRASLQ
jgi:hypothetical protein